MFAMTVPKRHKAGDERCDERFFSFSAIRQLISIAICYLLLAGLAMAGYRFYAARSAQERRVVFRIRWLVYRGSGYIDETAYPVCILRDAYEDHSTSLLACYKGEPVGTLRLTRLDKGSPIHNLFNIRIPVQAEHTAEIGRFAVLPQYRSKGRWVTMGLTLMMYLVSLRQGFRWWVGYTPEGLLRSFSGVFEAQAIPQSPLEPAHLEARTAMPGYFRRFEHCLVCFMAPVSSASPLGWISRLVVASLGRAGWVGWLVRSRFAAAGRVSPGVGGQG